ncbi:MAG: exodeoxyribonuclease VII large subunit [Tissierellia bacterium]|nr:exodeoxyribonuclease VII large subunit [Tissierellia bacterium]
MKPISVSELVAYLAKVVDSDFLLQSVDVAGEISQVTTSSQGHSYMTVKDAGAQISCVLFQRQRRELSFTPKAGMSVQIHGSVQIYRAQGRLQLIIDSMELEGVGALHELFLKRRDLLQQEGLFAVERKKEIPKNPATIGLVTSPTGAALVDFVEVSRRRNPAIEIIVAPSTVQGDSAPQQMVEALKLLDEMEVDLIVLTRGGGSIEDLFAFNDVDLVRTVASMKHPIVTAVGHEVDTTLVDYASDLRAATPSHGAELLVPLRSQWLQEEGEKLRAMEGILTSGLQGELERMARVKDRLEHMVSPQAIVEKREALSRLGDLLKESVEGNLRGEILALRQESKQLNLKVLKREWSSSLEKLLDQVNLMEGQAQGALRAIMEDWERRKSTMATTKTIRYRPLTTDQRGQRVHSVRNLRVGDRLHIRYVDGTVATTVDEIVHRGKGVQGELPREE